MAKHTLTLEEDHDFDLIGLCSHQSDYRVVWSLNENLDYQLSKADEFYGVSNKRGSVISEHSFYEWFDEVNHLDFYFIKNKAGNGKYLIPETAQVDYFLVIRENYAIEIDDLIAKLKSISSIITVVLLNPDELKSAGNLIF